MSKKGHDTKKVSISESDNKTKKYTIEKNKDNKSE